MYVHVDIDPEDILDELDDSQLATLGLRRVAIDPPTDLPATRDVHWPSIGEAIRRRDFDRASQLLHAIADQQGYTLPPSVLASAA